MPYLKCLTPDEVTYILREIHEGVCGNHSRPQSQVGKMIRAGYFWLTMQRMQLNLQRNMINVSGLAMCSIYLGSY